MSGPLAVAARLVAIAPPIVFLIFALMLARREFTRSRYGIVRLLTQEISTSLGMNLQVADIDAAVPGRLLLRHTNLARKGAGTLLSAERATIWYSPRALLRNPSQASAAIYKIDVRRPVVYLERGTDGRLNYAKLFKRRPGKRQPFQAKIVLSEGTVYYTDRRPVSRKVAAFTVRADGVNGSLEFGPLGGGYFHTTARRSTVSGPFSVVGAFNGQGLVLTASTQDMSLPFVDRCFIPTRAFGIPAGMATGRFQLAFQAKTPRFVHYYARARVKGGEIRAGQTMPRLTDIEGNVTLGNDQLVNFDVTGKALGCRWDADGTVAQLRQAVLSINARCDQVDWSSAMRSAPLRGMLPGLRPVGSGAAEISIQGPVSAPEISGLVEAPAAQWRQIPLRDGRVRFAFAQRRVSFRASASAGPGRIAAEGQTDLAGAKKTAARFRFERVPVALLHPELAGKAEGTGWLTSAGGHLRGGLEVNVSAPRAFGRSATSARAQLGLDGRTVRVGSLLVATPEGFVTASGHAGLDGQLDLDIAGVGVDAADIAAGNWSTRVTGTVDADGHLTGSLRRPSFQGQVQALDLAWDGQKLDVLRGDIQLSRDEIHTNALTVIRGSSEATLSGAMLQPLSPSRQVDISASARSLDLAALTAVFPQMQELQGRASGAISITGVVRQPNAAFDVQVQDARFRTYSAPLVSLKGDYSRGALNLKELTAEKGSATLSASGKLDAAGRLGFTFSLNGLPIQEALQMASGGQYAVSGSVNASGSLGGTTSDPELDATLAGEEIRIGGETLGHAQSALHWRSGLLTISGARLPLAGGLVTVDKLVFSTRTQDSGLLSASVFVGGESAQKLTSPVDAGRLAATARGLGLLSGLTDKRARDMAIAAPEHLGGALTGTLSVARAAAGWTASLEITGTGLQIWGVQVPQTHLTGDAGPGGLTVQEFVAEGPEMQVTGRGRLDKDGTLVADVEGNNVAIGALPALQTLSVEKGMADFSVQAEGTLEKPRVTASLLVRDAVVAGVKIEQFSTGRVECDADSADFSEATITSGENRVRFSGTAPFSVTRMAMVDGGKMDMKGELVNQDLSVLTMFLPQLDPARTKGPTQAGVAVSGQWPHPQIAGAVRVADGQIGIRGMDTLLRDVRVEMDLSGDRVDIRTFSLASSEGGSTSLTGGASLTAGGWQLDANAKADSLALRFANLTGIYKESYAGRLDGALRVAGPLGAPQVTGHLEAHDGTVGLPVIPEKIPEPRTPVINPTFDVTLEAGKGLRVRGPRLNAGVRGSFQLTRTLARPSVRGRLNVVDGYLLFPGSRFRVIPVGTIDLNYAPPRDTRTTVDIRAQTSVSTAPPRTGSRLTATTNYRVEMSLKGPLDNPNVTLQSNPPGLSSGNIFSLLGQQAGLGTNGVASGVTLQQEMTQLLTANIVPGVLEPVEQALAQAFGLQEVAFSFGRLEPLNVQISRRLFDGVSATFWRTLATGEEQSEWKLSYDLSKRLSLSYGRSRYGAGVVGLEGTVSF